MGAVVIHRSRPWEEGGGVGEERRRSAVPMPSASRHNQAHGINVETV
jgi:hypothetical protein